MNSVSPVKTTLCFPSRMSQQMLSCVWHGVCSAVTSMSPILSLWPCAGVTVTPLQSLPPQMGTWGRKVSRWGVVSWVPEGGRRGKLRAYDHRVAAGVVVVAEL